MKRTLSAPVAFETAENERRRLVHEGVELFRQRRRAFVVARRKLRRDHLEHRLGLVAQAFVLFEAGEQNGRIQKAQIALSTIRRRVAETVPSSTSTRIAPFAPVSRMLRPWILPG